MDQVENISEEIVECARSIRPHLTKLLGPEGKVIERRLTGLLERAERGEQVDDSLLDLLAQHTPTREWAGRYLINDDELDDVDKTFRDYHQLPGAPQAALVQASGPTYFCPDCGYRWRQRVAGQTPPTPCPTTTCRRIALVPVT